MEEIINLEDILNMIEQLKFKNTKRVVLYPNIYLNDGNYILIHNLDYQTGLYNCTISYTITGYDLVTLCRVIKRAGGIDLEKTLSKSTSTSNDDFLAYEMDDYLRIEINNLIRIRKLKKILGHDK
jgi:hypothetical protein